MPLFLQGVEIVIPANYSFWKPFLQGCLIFLEGKVLTHRLLTFLHEILMVNCRIFHIWHQSIDPKKCANKCRVPLESTWANSNGLYPNMRSEIRWLIMNVGIGVKFTWPGAIVLRKIVTQTNK